MERDYRILFVEDYDADAMLLTIALKKSLERVEIVRMTSGAGALERLMAEGPEAFQLIILDLGLPDVPSPLQFYERIVSHSRCPIVIYSGGFFPEVAVRFTQMGAAGCVVKGMSAELAVQAILTAGRIHERRQCFLNGVEKVKSGLAQWNPSRSKSA